MCVRVSNIYLLFHLTGKFTTIVLFSFTLAGHRASFYHPSNPITICCVQHEISAKQCSELEQTEVESRMEGCQYPTLEDRWMLSTKHSLLTSKENNSPVKSLIISFPYLSGVFTQWSLRCLASCELHFPAWAQSCSWRFFSQGLFPWSWVGPRGPNSQGKTKPHGQVYAL